MARSLYDTLGLTKEATHAEIKKAYHAMCLRLHPDKNPGDEVRALAPACAVRLRAHRCPSCRSPRSKSFRRCSACTPCLATLRSGAYAREGVRPLVLTCVTRRATAGRYMTRREWKTWCAATLARRVARALTPTAGV